MKVLGVVALLLMFSGIFAFTDQVQKKSPVIIQGKVVEDVTGKPVAKAHVYILEGEEEALTNVNGEFRIESWQKTPLKLTVDNYTSYRRITIMVKDPAQKQVIRLKVK